VIPSSAVRRLLLALLTCAAVARAQPATANVPTQGSGLAVAGGGAVTAGIWLPDFGTPLTGQLLLGAGGGDLAVYSASSFAAATLSNVPSPADAISVAYGVPVGGIPRTLVALNSGGSTVFGTIETGQFVDRTPAVPRVPGGLVALAPTVTGGALLVTDGFQLTRWELGTDGGAVSPIVGATLATPESIRSMFLDGVTERAFLGGNVVGLYAIPGALDAGPPRLLDSAALGGGRIQQPVTGLAVYRGTNVSYLLVGNSLGITVYDLPALPADLTQGDLTQFRNSARIFRPQLPSGTLLTSYTGLAVTNLPTGSLVKGAVLIGTTGALQVLRWDDLANAGSTALAIDTTYDPRLGLATDGGPTDGGTDGGTSDGGGGGGGGAGGGGGNTPLAPGIPIDHGGGCATTPAGASTLAAVLVALALLLSRGRQTR
jgi:uncharacterized membrane protein YgcG